MDEHEGKIELPLFRKRPCGDDDIYDHQYMVEWGVWRSAYDDHGGEG